MAEDSSAAQAASRTDDNNSGRTVLNAHNTVDQKKNKRAEYSPASRCFIGHRRVKYKKNQRRTMRALSTLAGKQVAVNVCSVREPLFYVSPRHPSMRSNKIKMVVGKFQQLIRSSQEQSRIPFLPRISLLPIQILKIQQLRQTILNYFPCILL